MKKAVGLKDMIFHTSGGCRMVPSKEKIAIPVNNGISEGVVVKFLA